MKIKRWVLFLLFIPLFLLGCKITPVAAQEDRDSAEIKRIVEAYLRDFANNDIDSAMKYASANYSNTEGNEIIDYAKFKSNTKNLRDILFKKYTDYSLIDIKILKSDIRDNKAIIEIGYVRKGFNLDTLKEDSIRMRSGVSLAKEDNAWKITKWDFLK